MTKHSRRSEEETLPVGSLVAGRYRVLRAPRSELSGHALEYHSTRVTVRNHAYAQRCPRPGLSDSIKDLHIVACHFCRRRHIGCLRG